MRAVVQRISRAEVRIGGAVVGKCGRGLLVLVAAHRDDTPPHAEKLADRVAKLRIFGDAEGKMNLSLDQLDPPGAILAVSNFTLYGETERNRRPSFIDSAPYDKGEELYDVFVAKLKSLGVAVETGRFGATMDVDLVNEGPVTVILDAGP